MSKAFIYPLEINLLACPRLISSVTMARMESTVNMIFSVVSFVALVVEVSA